MIKAERIKEIKKLDDPPVYQVTFKSQERFNIPIQGVGLVSFLEEVAPKLDQVKAYLIVDTETAHILAATMRVRNSWPVTLTFTKEMDERQARGLIECLARLQGSKKRERGGPNDSRGV